MLPLIFLLILALLGGFLVFVSTKPDGFRYERSTVIQAPASKIFPLIEDLHAWREWSPWEGLDPNLQRTYSGAESGVGAHYAYSGNKKVGQGTMKITASQAPHELTIELHFIAPFEANNTAHFSLEEAGGGTTVRWAMTGKRPFMVKLIGTFVDMEALIGKDFDKGLAQLKALAEK